MQSHRAVISLSFNHHPLDGFFFGENMKVDTLKIILIIISYTLNNFHYSCENVIVDLGK
jgi:hypothetical protein